MRLVIDCPALPSLLTPNRATFNLANFLTFLSDCLNLCYFYRLGEHQRLGEWKGPPVHLVHLERFTSVCNFDPASNSTYRRYKTFHRAFLGHIILPASCLFHIGDLKAQDIPMFANWLAPQDRSGPTHIRIAPRDCSCSRGASHDTPHNRTAHGL